MSWPVHSLGSLIESDGGVLQTGPFGSQLKQAEYTSDGVPVIMPTDIENGEVNERTVARVPETTVERLSRHKIRAGGIVLPRRGAITKRAFIRPDQEGWLCGTGCIKIELNGLRIWPRYLYYYLGLKNSVDWLERNAVGSTMLNLSAEIVSRFPMVCPSIPTQRRIADMLSAYDELIENNRRRIALLEQAARELYREWFVRLRFPGHENSRIVDGLPAGWGRVRLSDVVSTQYGYTASASEEPIGPKFLRGKDINKNSYIDWDTVPYCPTSDLNFGKYALRTGDLLVVRMADPGKVAIVEKKIQAIFASYLVRLVIHDESRAFPLYLFYVLTDSEYQGFIGAASGGSTRKSASAKLLTDFGVIQPPNAIQSLFVDHVAPLRKMIGALLDQNAQARASREILLPRLMSGEVAA